MLLDDLTLLTIIGNGGERPCVMMVNDLTLLPIIGNGGGRPYEMTVNDLTLLPIITNAGGRLDVITNYCEGWWTIIVYYALLRVITDYWEWWWTTLRNDGERPYVITHYYECW